MLKKLDYDTPLNLQNCEILGSVLLLLGMYLLSAGEQVTGFSMLVLSSLVWVRFCILGNFRYMMLLHFGLILININGLLNHG